MAFIANMKASLLSVWSHAPADVDIGMLNTSMPLLSADRPLPP